jgi:hypothetical protein
MPLAGFEPATSATKRPQIYSLDRAATGIGPINVQWTQNNWELRKRHSKGEKDGKSKRGSAIVNSLSEHVLYNWKHLLLTAVLSCDTSAAWTCFTLYNTRKWLYFLSLCAIVFRSPPASHLYSSNGQWSSQLFWVYYKLRNSTLFFLLKAWWVRPKRGCLLTLAYYAFPRWYELEERRWNDILTRENRRTLRKTCPSATLSTTNPTWIDLVANPGFRGERPATNDLSHGTAQSHAYFYVFFSTNNIKGHTESNLQLFISLKTCRLLPFHFAVHFLSPHLANTIVSVNITETGLVHNKITQHCVEVW